MNAGRPVTAALRGALRADRSPRAARIEPAAAGGHDFRALPRLLHERYGVALWIALGIALALGLRAPWFHAALGRDEGGVAMIARSFHGGGEFAYGSLFLDRPPLLVGLYSLAVGHGVAGIRALGAIASAALVVTSTLLAVRLAGRSAAPWAAGISALLASSFALNAEFTPAELLAAVPASASVLLLVIALERSSQRLWLLAGAGALAAAALLVKQSFGDALAAGAVAVAGGAFAGISRRETARRAAAFGAGVALVGVGLLVWERLAHVPSGAVFYALFGFRLDATSTLAGGGQLGMRLSRLGPPLLGSGLLLGVPLALAGFRGLRQRPLLRVVLWAWITVAVAGIALGGSYWPHYLIALVPATAAGAAAFVVRHRRIGAVLVLAIVLPFALLWSGVPLTATPASYEQDAVSAGHYLRARAEPHQTAYVLYAKANVLYYSGLRDPFPYNWSLMMRSAPGAQARLRQLLASPRRPTWVIQWQSHHAFGLDRSGATGRLLTRRYRRVATVCGRPVWLARGARARPAPPSAGGCTAGDAAPGPTTVAVPAQHD